MTSRPRWPSAGTPTGRYVDPITDPVTGVDSMVDLILDFGRRFPGAALTPTGTPEFHHHVGRFGWVMTAPAPIVVGDIDHGHTLRGFDVVEFAPDQRIAGIVGFFDTDTPSG